MSTSTSLEKNVQKLEQLLSEHREFLTDALKHSHFPVRSMLPTEATVDKERFRTLILETIEAIENTRKAFKSKQLEALRKKLIAALAEQY